MVRMASKCGVVRSDLARRFLIFRNFFFFVYFVVRILKTVIHEIYEKKKI